MPELCGAVGGWREGNVLWPRAQAALKGTWNSPCPVFGLGTACEGQQVAPSWFCELAQAGQDMGQVTVLAVPLCCSGGPGSVCWCCGSACCAAGAALPCVVLCSGLISLQRSCTNGCSSSGATRCCPWPWEMTSMTWGKSPEEGWWGPRGALQLCPGADDRAVCCSHHGAAPAALWERADPAHNPPVPGPGLPASPGSPMTPECGHDPWLSPSPVESRAWLYHTALYLQALQQPQLCSPGMGQRLWMVQGQ